jgi:tetrapyrrole methylase family protein / MazG family protein
MTEDAAIREKRLIEAFLELQAIVHRLRAPGGCPWDRKQTPESLKQYIVEEAYEVIDAIDSGDASAMTEELGDLLLQVVLQAEIASEKGAFSLREIMRTLSKKLVHRHPHVFADKTVNGADEVISNWEKIKGEEKAGRGLFDGLPRHLPALQTAGRMGEKAGRVGFDWPDIGGVREKVDEELAELDEAIREGDDRAVRHEIGDLLFAVAQWSRHLGVEPEEALRDGCRRFQNRFEIMEELAREETRQMGEMDIQALEALWQRAKGRS